MNNFVDFQDYKEKLTFFSDPLPEELVSQINDSIQNPSSIATGFAELCNSSKLFTDFYIPIYIVFSLILEKKKGLIIIPKERLHEAKITEKLNAEQIYGFLHELHENDQELLDRLIQNYGSFNNQRLIIKSLDNGEECFCQYMEAEYQSHEMTLFRLGINISYDQYQLWKTIRNYFFNQDDTLTYHEFKDRQRMLLDEMVHLHNDYETAEFCNNLEYAIEEVEKLPEIYSVYFHLAYLIKQITDIFPFLDGIEQLAFNKIKERALRFHLPEDKFIRENCSVLTEWFNHDYDEMGSDPVLIEKKETLCLCNENVVRPSSLHEEREKKLNQVMILVNKLDDSLVEIEENKYNWKKSYGILNYLLKKFDAAFYYRLEDYSGRNLQWKNYKQYIPILQDQKKFDVVQRSWGENKRLPKCADKIDNIINQVFPTKHINSQDKGEPQS